MKRGEKRMLWIIVGVVVSYLIVNLPLIYSLLYVHGIRGIGQLWGYAPNQFFFLVVVFPIVAFFSFLAFTLFVKELYATVQLNSKVAYFFEHYPIFFLCCLILTSILTIVVYYTSAWSLDKLKPQYVEKTFDAINKFEKQIDDSSKTKEEQESTRKQIVREAKDKIIEFKREKIPATYSSDEIDRKLNELEASATLQIMHNRYLSHNLRLIHPVIQILNILQLFFVLLIGSFLIFITVVSLIFATEVHYDGSNHAELNQMLKAIFWAVFFFSFYVICFQQYRYQIEELVGKGSTILQDILVGIVVLFVLIFIKYVETNTLEISVKTITPFLPILAPISGITIEAIAPEMMKQYIGTETTLGFQIIFSLLFWGASIVPIYQTLKL